MQDLKDVTRESHYENYRARCIQSMTRMVIQERKRRLAEGTETGTGSSLASSPPSLVLVALSSLLGSLSERFGGESDVDVPLPLAVSDAEKERLVLEKEQEVRRSSRARRGFEGRAAPIKPAPKCRDPVTLSRNSQCGPPAKETWPSVIVPILRVTPRQLTVNRNASSGHGGCAGR